jgi:glycosyltransferase involved in cell wall biosynthesis
MKQSDTPEILFITSYPPRECGIATYSNDLINELEKKFSKSFNIQVCALETTDEQHEYPQEVKYKLNTSRPEAFSELVKAINHNSNISMVVVQHEFGFFHQQEEAFRQFLFSLIKPVVVVFHTVLPQPDEMRKLNIQNIAAAAESIIVMTSASAKLLADIYDIPQRKIRVIPHGTHLVPHLDKNKLKEKYGLSGKKIMATFGLLSSGKGIETTLEALPSVVINHPDALFLIIGKTHPGVVKQEGERYRQMLEKKVKSLGLEAHVKFVNYYLKLPELLEYLQLTDIYLFTSRDPFQAVSGTFSYALSCGCAIISTPIPHAKEVLGEGAGIIVDFGNAEQLSNAINRLLDDEELRKDLGLHALHRIAPTAWENTAVKHGILFEKIAGNKFSLDYNLPAFNLQHIKNLTTDFGIVQFAKINRPDMDSGYTLDDNARALIALCQYFEITAEEEHLKYIRIYFNFLQHCMQPESYFLNYVDKEKKFTDQNNEINLADSNGRAVWALGYLISKSHILPADLVESAEKLMQLALAHVEAIHSTRAMAFTIKGLHYYNMKHRSAKNTSLIEMLGNRLVQMYRHEAEDGWEWFESYLTYANSILPESLVYAYIETGDSVYKDIAKTSFDFLLNNTFNENGIKVISNKTWLKKGESAALHGEQPIDVAYTILALSRFYKVFKNENYLYKMQQAFNWFLGNNHLQRVIYNPCTGGCFDGLEEDHVNLNQGAESTVSFLMARCTVEKYLTPVILQPGKLRFTFDETFSANRKINYMDGSMK